VIGKDPSLGLQDNGKRLIIGSADLDDTASYVCRATNPAGRAELKHLLTIFGKSSYPLVIGVTAGETPVLFVNAFTFSRPEESQVPIYCWANWKISKKPMHNFSRIRNLYPYQLDLYGWEKGLISADRFFHKGCVIKNGNIPLLMDCNQRLRIIGLIWLPPIPANLISSIAPASQNSQHMLEKGSNLGTRDLSQPKHSSFLAKPRFHFNSANCI